MNRRAMPSPITRLPYRVATVCAAALALAACNPAGGGGAGEPPLAGAAIGGPFTLTASDGRTVQWEDFAGKYTDEMVALGEGGLIWNAEELAKYIPNAKEYIGAKTSMTPQKLDDVTDVIAYLAQFGPEAAAE